MYIWKSSVSAAESLDALCAERGRDEKINVEVDGVLHMLKDSEGPPKDPEQIFDPWS